MEEFFSIFFKLFTYLYYYYLFFHKEKQVSKLCQLREEQAKIRIKQLIQKHKRKRTRTTGQSRHNVTPSRSLPKLTKTAQLQNNTCVIHHVFRSLFSCFSSRLFLFFVHFSSHLFIYYCCGCCALFLVLQNNTCVIHHVSILSLHSSLPIGGFSLSFECIKKKMRISLLFLKLQVLKSFKKAKITP